MVDLKLGDIVARKSYGCDVFFKVVDIKEEGDEKVMTLKGISYRIEADAPEADLELQPEQKVSEYRSKCCLLAERRQPAELRQLPVRGVGFGYRPPLYSKKAYSRSTSKAETRGLKRPGRILHLDGDEEYLNTCMDEYRKLGVSVTGQFVPEKDQAASIRRLLSEHRPDILVLTGHDGFIKGSNNYSDLSSYRNSRYFVDAVKEARKIDNNLDSLVIFAGACQSMYSEILKAGANFASSPKRALIHALDPVRICEKIAFGSFERIIDPEEVIGNTITGMDGIGGVQTRGKYREGHPSDNYGSNVL